MFSFHYNFMKTHNNLVPFFFLNKFVLEVFIVLHKRTCACNSLFKDHTPYWQLFLKLPVLLFNDIFKSNKTRSISLFILLTTRQMFAHCFPVRSSFSVVKSGLCFSIISILPF